MRKSLGILFVVLFLAGCNYSPEDRLVALRQAKEPTLAVVDAATFTIDSLILQINAAEEILKNPELDAETAEKVASTIKKAKSELERLILYRQPFLNQVEQIDKAIADIIERGDVTLADEIGVYLPAVRAVTTKLPPPYGTFVDLGILLITTGLGIYGGLKTQKTLNQQKLAETQQQAKAVEQTLVGVVKSVSTALKKVPEDNKGEVLAALKESQEDSGVRGEVVKLLN